METFIIKDQGKGIIENLDPNKVVSIGSLGKNVATNLLASKPGAGLQLGAPWSIGTAGQPFSITGLSDKSVDATYATMLVENAAGQVAKSNGKPFIKGMPALLTEAEKTTWKTEMNGGWTTNTMSVALINPPVIQKIDTIQYITLLGANLNFNPISFSVQIVSTNGSTLIATIPNNQVQLQQNGLSLVFYYNFKDIPIGEYKIKLNNGLVDYTTQVTFSIISSSEIIYVDKSQITWDVKSYNDGEYTDYILSPSSINLSSDVKNSSGGNLIVPDNTPIASAISSFLKLINGDNLTYQDNFYIEYISDRVGNASGYTSGISSEALATINDNVLQGHYFIYAYGWGSVLSIQRIANWVTVIPTKTIIVKNKNLLTLIISNSLGTVIDTAIINSMDNIRLKLIIKSRSNMSTNRASLNFITAYKF